jgi:predicted SprT family Zn-dependent metalloprotease
MQGKRKSERCEHCQHHPTKRVYLKKSNVFRGMAWFCEHCKGFTLDTIK